MMKEIPVSPREAEVGNLMKKGLNHVEIAERMFIQASSVKAHVTRLFRVMNVKSRPQFIVAAAGYKFVAKKRGKK